MSRTIVAGALGAALLLSASGAGAGVLPIVTVSSDGSAPVDVPGLAGFVTTGADMNGMRITASFLDGSSETAIWGATGADSGSALGTDWGLSLAGDSFFNEWTLSNSSTEGLGSLSIEALPGGSVLDRTFFGFEATDGSSLGRTFNVSGDGGLQFVDAMYSQPVGVGGAAPIGDLWGRLDLTLTRFIGFGVNGGLGAGSRMSFYQDTDNLRQGGMELVPLPGAVAMAAPMLLIGATRRRRR